MKNIKNMVMLGAVALLTATGFTACTDGNDWEVDENYDRLFHSTQSSLSITPDATTAEVTFKKTPNTTYYVMQVSQDSLFDDVDESDVKIITFGEDGSITTTPYTLSGLAGDTKYYFRMKGRYVPSYVPEGGEDCPQYQKKESNWVYLKKGSFKTKAEQIFNAITDLDRNENTMHLSWTPGAEVTHITVAKDEEVVSTVELDDDAKAAGEYTVSGLEPSTVYTFTIYNGEAKRGTVTGTTTDASPAAEYKITCTGDLDADLKNVAAQAEADGKSNYSVTVIIPGGSSVTAKSVSETTGEDASLKIPAGMSVTFFGGAGEVPTLNIVKNIDVAGVHSSVTFQNLNVTGTGYFVNQSSAASVSELNIIDCKMSGFTGNTFVRIQNSSVTIGKISIKNSIISDCGKNYAFFDLRNGTTTDINIDGCTFYNICTTGKCFIQSTGKNFNSITISNTTFNNICGNAQYFIDLASGYDATTFTLTNVLFGKSADETTNKNIRSTNAPVVTNSYSTTDWYKVIKGVESCGAASTSIFADPDNGDFTLKNTELKSKNVGDPRWITE